MLRRLKELFIGSPLETASLHEQRLSKKSALAVLASDNLSSTAYATEEILLALTAAAAVGVAFPTVYAIPIAAAIVGLTAIVAISYGQTLHAYPTGGGAYTVAKENLGVTAGLTAGAALLIDYTLTVAVSIAAGIAALTSAFPALYEFRVLLCLLAIALILLANLRGVRESAAVFTGPVYIFIGSAYLLVIGGLVQYVRADQPLSLSVTPPQAPMLNFLTVFLLLRAFASGSAALTGIEAVSQGVQVFRPPASRNAATTLYILAFLLATLFFGITALAYLYHATPREGETVVSQLGRVIFGTGPVYYLIQAATMTILLLAANTSFTGFPRLASVLAQDRFMPRQLANLGDRLVFSNGILVLSGLAGLLVVIFDARVHSLIPLYMVGVFLAFTLSQWGMVQHWRRSQAQGAGGRAWVNAVGALTTALVLIVVAVVKFKDGAYLVVFGIPAQVWICRQIRKHYYMVGRELSLADYEKPEPRRHLAVVPVAGMNRVVLPAVEYARAIAQDVVAVTVNVDNQDREEMLTRWAAWAPGVPLVVLESPYRSIQRPLIRFIEEIDSWREDDLVTVVIPEYVPARWWHQLLHNQTSLWLKAALFFKPGIIVTNVPQHARTRRDRSEGLPPAGH
ncbi:MAG: APC family permease [Acidobacteria bacterium]|nr:APC family permease [Acidobacteriota bacterium]